MTEGSAHLVFHFDWNDHLRPGWRLAGLRCLHKRSNDHPSVLSAFAALKR